VYALDRSLDVLKKIETEFGRAGRDGVLEPRPVEQHVLSADLVIGRVLVPGAAAPAGVAQMVKAMKTAGSGRHRDRPGRLLRDFAADHAPDPTYVVDDVVHYCVTNMPGAVPRTSTYALNNATLPFVLALANKGWKQALADDPHLRNGLNVARGKVTHPEVAAAVTRSIFHPRRS